MDILLNAPSWDEVERNLSRQLSGLGHNIQEGFRSTSDGWTGFKLRADAGFTQAYGYVGGNRIDSVRLALVSSYPIIQNNLKHRWASIEIERILPVLMQVIREVVMIVGGSVAIGAMVGGFAGALAFGAGAGPGAVIGGGIGLQVGNLILMALGLSAISEYFCNGLSPCLSLIYEGIKTAWGAENSLEHAGLDPTGGAAAKKADRIQRAAWQLACGQEQLVLLLLTAIVTYLMRGQIRSSVLNSMETVATRSASLRAGMRNREMAAWLARNEQKMIADPRLQANEPVALPQSQTPSGHLGTQQRINSSSEASSSAPRTRLPRTRGKWGPDGKGVPGESDWYSEIPAVNEITKGSPIPFSNGRPDFSQWSKGAIRFEPGVLDGSPTDFKAAYIKIQETKGLDSPNSAKLLLRQLSLTPHHLDSETIQLIPSNLHGNIPHVGSASDLRLK